MTFIDTHTHPYDTAFDADREAVLQRALDAGVSKWIFPAIDSTCYQRQLECFNNHPNNAFMTIGLHPTSVAANWGEELKFVEEKLKNSVNSHGYDSALSRRPRYYAIGEIGLDGYWSKEFMKEQMEVFSAQIDMAAEYDLPIIIHERSAKMKIILSSNSPRRRELLAGLGIDFEVKVIEGVDESYPDTLPSKDVAEYIADEKDAESNAIEQKLAAQASVAKEKASYKMAFAEKSQERAKKSSPLVVIDNTALSDSNASKRERIMQEELSNFKPENLESVIVLDNPLYIIDGHYFSEDDLFGPQPKSPYAPLNHQDIKTIVILKDTDAVSKYGEKGKKGVVIITTKTGKPAVQK
jgi:predicted metal-dependent TIM-barrel fold hydrolase